MLSKCRSYIASESKEVIELQILAKKHGMEVFVEVNEKFPPNFIDTLPFLAFMCEKFQLEIEDLKCLTEEFLKRNEKLLKQLNSWRSTGRPHEVTTSFLLTVAVVRKYAEHLDVESLQKIGWHEEVAKIVLET